MNGWNRPREQARLLEMAAAASLGLAVGFAVWIFAVPLGAAGRLAVTVFAGAIVFAAAYKLLDRLAAETTVSLADFEFAPIEPSAHLLRLQDVLAQASAADSGTGELLLEDALPAAAPDSRVVQLFEATLLPTAGELRARIDRHLDGRGDPPPPVDHSGELFEALASLKRSLG